MELATNSFNDMLHQFMDMLVTAFPQQQPVKDARTAVLVMIQSTDAATRQYPMNTFWEAIRPHAEAIKGKDDGYMSRNMDSIPVIKDLELKPFWDSPRMPPETREAIWYYLNQLMQMCSLLAMVPPEMMPMLNKFTGSEQFSQLLGQVKDSGGMPDMSAMMSAVQQFASAEGYGPPGQDAGAGASYQLPPGLPAETLAQIQDLQTQYGVDPSRLLAQYVAEGSPENRQARRARERKASKKSKKSREGRE